MKKILVTNLILFFTSICFSQNFTGQWKGEFVDNSAIISWGSNTCDYVIDLDVKGTFVSGFSYTYFTDGGKKYYTICKLVGKINSIKNYIEITETERTKTNVPNNINNSFQLHKLTWHKEKGNEFLEGNWVAAPGQDKTNTGFGTTLLAKRQLTEISALAKKMNSGTKKTGSPERQIGELVKEKNKANTIAQNKKSLPKKAVTVSSKLPTKKATNDIAKTKPKLPIVVAKNDTSTAKKIPNKVSASLEHTVPTGFEKRTNEILKTVEVENTTIKIELYDNGEVDGDSVSLFYNGKVLLAHKILTTKPITLDIEVENDNINELIMYADNLGTIPPNTALMIVTDGTKRYEVRITSDLKKSGAIRFLGKKSNR
ncbi:MAG: hypothetical protein ABL929_09675 [Ferruginibacter sp.]|nr:hypothetical protein [Ferruginibacter sp.]